MMSQNDESCWSHRTTTPLHAIPTILLCVNIEMMFAGLKVGHLHKSTTLQILMYVPLNLLKIAIGACRSCSMAKMCWLEPKSKEKSVGCKLELFVLILGC
jgi:hypothetical protein